MANKFKSIMEKRSDYELLVIVEELRNEYQPEAVIAAEAEIKKRNFDFANTRKAKEEEDLKKQEAEEKKGFTELIYGNMPKKEIRIYWILLSLIIPGCFIVYMLLFNDDEKENKSILGRHIWKLYLLANLVVILLIIYLISLFK